MTELPEGVRGRVLGAALLLVVLLATWLGAVVPLTDWYAARADRLAAQSTLARRMAQIAAELPELRRLVSETSGPAPVPLLEGATDALAGAALQQLVQEIAANAGANLASTEALPAEPAGTYRRIGLRVAVSSPWPVLVQMLAAIAGGQPRMLVNDLQIQGSRGLVQDGAAPLNASIVVSAFRAGAPQGTQ